MIISPGRDAGDRMKII